MSRPKRNPKPAKYFCRSTSKCGWRGIESETKEKKGSDFMGDYTMRICPNCGNVAEQI